MSKNEITYGEAAQLLGITPHEVERAGFPLDRNVRFFDHEKDSIPVINDLRVVVSYETQLLFNGSAPNGNGANRVVAVRCIPPDREFTLVAIDSPQHIQNKVFNIVSNEIVDTFVNGNNTPTTVSREAKPLSLGLGPYKLTVTTTSAHYVQPFAIGNTVEAKLTPTVKIFINGQSVALSSVTYPAQGGEATHTDSWIFNLQ